MRTFSQLRLRFEGSYPLSVPSSILTMRPSHEALMLSSRKLWICSISWPSMLLAKANSPSTGVKDWWSRSRRYDWSRH